MTNERHQLLQAAATYLAAHDHRLAPIIAQAGPCTIEPHSQYYQELVDSIIGQQLSIKAADTILGRFKALFGGRFPTPEQILTKTPDELRAVGLSRAKVSYVQDLALHILEGRLQVGKLPRLSNEEVIRELTAVKGIGEWTAHMFLMFSLGRLDVLAVGDLGIRTAAMRLYELPTLPSAEQLRALADKHHWAPYESIACWYLWRSLNNEPAKSS